MPYRRERIGTVQQLHPLLPPPIHYQILQSLRKISLRSPSQFPLLPMENDSICGDY